MFRTIHLHGAAAIEFGGPYRFECDTPREAFRALFRLKPGFAKFVTPADWRIVRGPLGKGLDTDESMLGLRFGNVTEMHMIPVISGAGRGKGIGKIVAGVAIAVAAVVLAIPSGGASIAAAGGAAAAAAAGAGGALAVGLGTTAFLGITYGSILMTGIAMALGGVAQLLAPNPKVGGYSDNDHPENRPSALFSGPVNTSAEGSVVPIVYGKRVRCGSVVGAAGIYVEDIPV